ncbi:MAG: diacylglycerol kinase family protein [Bacteroidota bacterium]
MIQKWFVIYNPKSGKSKDKINHLKDLLSEYNISYELAVTEYKKHDFKLTQSAIKKGFRKFICVGGDGTLHYVINGIMQQKEVPTISIKIGVIPVGTGNDWVKTYNIPLNINKAFEIIKKEKTIVQDIGKIELSFPQKREENKEHIVYFDNAAGLGFDGLVVKNHHLFKKFNSYSYLLSALYSYFKYKNNIVDIKINDKKFKTPLFLIVIGICKYSGGGMQLTDYKNKESGKFNITLIKKISYNSILKSITKVFKGDLSAIKEIFYYKTNSISINYIDYKPIIQADGELLGEGNCKICLIKDAVQFVVA